MEAVDIRQLAEAQQPYMVALRRRFHAEPEISGQEFGTRETLIKELSGMGIPYTLLLGTGLIAKLEGRRPGPPAAKRHRRPAAGGVTGQSGAAQGMRISKTGGLPCLRA